MEQQSKSIKFLRRRKLLLVLPLLVLPFTTFLFWSLGGGKAVAAKTQNQDKKGLNTQLPGAYVKKGEKPLDKMSYYEKAEQDSVKLKQQIQNDPYYRRNKDSVNRALASNQSVPMFKGQPSQMYSGSNTTDNNKERQVYQKLAQLNEAIHKPVENKSQDLQADAMPAKNVTAGSAMADLEKLQQQINQKNSSDPELQQMGGMLSQILDIQHPDRVAQRMKEASEAHRGQVFPVALNNKNDSITLIANGVGLPTNDTGSHFINGFYSLDDQVQANEMNGAITAVVSETQTVVAGARIKLQLTQDVYVNGTLIPTNTPVFGLVALQGERLTVQINGIRYKNTVFPVQLTVYDLDGLPGIDIPGAITRDVAKQSADQSLQSIGMTSLDPSLAAQATTAGIEAAKTLISKKVKLIKATVKAGYAVLLKDEKQKQNQ